MTPSSQSSCGRPCQDRRSPSAPLTRPASESGFTRHRLPKSRAAFDAGTFQIKEAVPDLVAVLDSPPAAAEHEHDYLIAAVLDALIQIHALPDRSLVPVIAPANAPTRYYARWPVQILVLLERSGPDAGPILLELFHDATGYPWYAFANLLLTQPQPQPGFAAELVEGLKLELRSAVMDVDVVTGVGAEHGAFLSGIAGKGENPEGFPPHALYWMDDSPRPGTATLSIGPHPLNYTRFVTTASQFDTINTIGYGPTSEERLRYLEAMMRGQYRFYLSDETSVRIEWRDEQFVVARVAEERQKIAAAYERMLNLLVESAYLTAEEARARPMDLKIELIDQRTDRSRPLPEVH